MSDLINRLRKAPRSAFELSIFDEAANRIAELEAGKDSYIHCAAELTYANARIAELEAVEKMRDDELAVVKEKHGNALGRIAKLEAEAQAMQIKYDLMKNAAECNTKEVARLTAHIKQIAGHHEYQIMRLEWRADSGYHNERRDFALSGLTSPESSSQSPHPCSENSA